MPTQVTFIAAVTAKPCNRKPFQLRMQKRRQGFRRQGQIVVAEQQDVLVAAVERLVVELRQTYGVAGVDRAGQAGVDAMLNFPPQSFS